MDAVLNPWASQFVGSMERARRITPRATEYVRAGEVRDGDTIIDRNHHGKMLYRVVDIAREDIEPGKVILDFDTDRDTAGPGLDEKPPVAHEWLVLDRDARVERVTDLLGHEMTEVRNLRMLDRLADGREVWEVAHFSTSDGAVLVRFAREDDFARILPGTVMLVRGRTRNVHVRVEMNKSRNRRDHNAY